MAEKTSTIPDNMRKDGYSQEERYFQRLNERLAAERRERLDAERAHRQAEQERSLHWMKCPKCGHGMSEITFENVRVDRCGSCEGLYFDRGEVDLILSAHGPKHFWKRLGRFIADSFQRGNTGWLP